LKTVNHIAQTKQDVLAVLSKNRSRIKALGVKRLGLFGSFVHDQQKSESDVDLLVEFEQGQKTFDNFIELAFLLEDLLQRRVELLTRESLSPHIGPHILAEIEYASIAA
jgi:predicted nucleotidyltransferase